MRCILLLPRGIHPNKLLKAYAYIFWDWSFIPVIEWELQKASDWHTRVKHEAEATIELGDTERMFKSINLPSVLFYQQISELNLKCTHQLPMR